MSSLNIASRALTTNLAALQIIGNNIANVNTEGYSRQRVELTTSPGQFLGSGYFGKGVELAGVSRAYDEQLLRESQLTGSVASADLVRFERLKQLESLFPLGESSLGVSLNNALNAWSAVASSPSDTTARTVVISRAEELAGRLRGVSASLNELRLSATLQVNETRDAVNALAQQIADINRRIIEAGGAVTKPLDLLDQRDQLIKKLNTYVQATTVEDTSGGLTVFIGGSQPLVLGSRAASIDVRKNALDPLRLDAYIVQGGQSFKLNENMLGGGQLKGLLGFVNEDLPATINDIGRLTLSLVTQVNTQHRLGMDLNGNPGADFFSIAPITNGAGVQADGVTPATASISATVTDPTAFTASDYELRFDGVDWDIVRRSDGAAVASNTALPATVDGLTLDVVSAPAAGDVYLLRPFADAARDINVAIAQPDNVAAASPVTVTAASTNTGGLSIESLAATAAGPYATDTLTYNAADGRFDVNGGPLQVPTAPAQYVPGEPLDLGGWRIVLRGVPANGDALTVRPTLANEVAQNFGNAKSMLALRDVDSFGGVTLGDGYVSVFSAVASKVQSGKLSAEFSETAATNSDAALAAKVGVNLDEEAARLLQYQQAYQASAKFLQVAQGTFDILIQSFG